MNEKKTGAIYIRVSTDKQEELSPDAQLRLLHEYAIKNNITVPKEYVFQDNGISGRKAEKRPAFQNMIAIAKDKSHPIDTIIVWKFSRFARNQEESIVYKSLLKKNNVDVISVSEPLVDGPFGSLIERIIEWMDEYYSIRLSGEVMRGMTQNAMRGHYQSDAPIGYRSPGNRMPPEKDEKTIEIPIMMKDMLLSGKNITQIARKLNELGYRTKRGNLWDNRGVRYVLENPFYAGISRWNYTERGRQLKPSDQVIYTKGNWEPIWDQETHEKLVRILNESSSGPKKRNASNVKHWLSGIVTCSSCGSSLTSSGGSGKNAGLQCWKYAKGLCNESHYISYLLLEEYVKDSLRDILNDNDISYSVVYSGSIDQECKLQEYQQRLKKLSAREKRIKDAYLNEIDSLEEYRENKCALDRERDIIESDIKKIINSKIQYSKDEMDDKMRQNIIRLLEIIDDESVSSEAKGNAIRSVVDHISFDRKNTSLKFYLKLVF